MNYIYCYTNKINSHRYIGQTNNLNRRIREHRSSANNSKSLAYNLLFHKKLREYGEKNFQIEVLEILYNASQKEVDEREKYWIQSKNSYCLYGKGYNMTPGGNSGINPSRFSPEQIEAIKQDLKDNQLNFLEIQNKHDIKPSLLSMINHGEYAFDEYEHYPLRRYYKKDEDYEILINLLEDSDLSLLEIAKQLNIGYSTVKKINSGKMRKGIYPIYPIRKKRKSDKIKEHLLNTSESFQEIADRFQCSLTTVKRINAGKTHYNDNLVYPLRNL